MAFTITIIIPCYNESSRLQSSAFLSYLEENSETHFLFVDDGSTDGTVHLLKQLKEEAPKQISYIVLPQNSGKAEAVRQGIVAAMKTSVEFVGFWDADLATPLSEIAKFSSLLVNDQQKMMICGSRIKRLGACIERHWYRHYLGRIIATLVSNVLQLPTYDTQCGAKLFRRELATKIFPQPFLSRWLFDVELIARTIGFVGRDEAAKIIYELPITFWRDVGASKISISYLPKIPFEITRIYIHYRNELKRP
jgi:dolichyl-phosphate beta-glucosyltransferase